VDQDNEPNNKLSAASAAVGPADSAESEAASMSVAELKSFLEIIKGNDRRLIELANERGDLAAWRNALVLIRKARE
jgi:succinate dehydrogenase flavin-adding protein (antitoxin of CptAB toxin-antitoxin module)